MSSQTAMVDNDEYIESVKSYVLENHRLELLEILQHEDPLEHFSVTFNALNLFESHVSVGELLLWEPMRCLGLLDEALVLAAQVVYQGQEDKTDMCLKPNIHGRVTGLPVCPELTRSTLPKACDIGQFLSISGTVIRTTTVKMLELEKEFMCNQCKHIFTVQADFEQFYSVCRPTRCPNTEDCQNIMNFTAMGDKGASPERCHNYQEMKIQEQVARLSLGTIPRSMWVTLQDDLTDRCKPGDDVNICGVIRRRWRPVNHDSRCEIELVLAANHVQVTNEQRSAVLITQQLREEFAEFWQEFQYNPLVGRNHILASLCPQVYGLYVVKLAVAMVMAGGVQRTDESGTRVRGESHLLLVGDPGTGKSQFLKYASKVTPRSVLTTGIGSTSAGLTVTAVKDSGEWQLEAGALVLADGGLCCIDEFNSIKEADKTSIHEAMEQQSISVAKAGLVCKLNTRCTILAATNPKGQYDPGESLSVNVALGSPLLSRFDLVMVLLDTQNPDWDKVVSSYILRGKQPPNAHQVEKELWSMDKMQAYFSFVKAVKPRLSENATRVLGGYYRAQRQADDRNAARTTMRLLESMIRLSQAHARLLLHEEVTTLDAVVAVSVMESTMQSAALMGGVNALHTAFPDDPMKEYTAQAELILTRLGLTDILQEEMVRLEEQEAFHHAEKPGSQPPIIFSQPQTQPQSQSCSQSQHRDQPKSQSQHRHQPKSQTQPRDQPYSQSQHRHQSRTQSQPHTEDIGRRNTHSDEDVEDIGSGERRDKNQSGGQVNEMESGAQDDSASELNLERDNEIQIDESKVKSNELNHEEKSSKQDRDMESPEATDQNASSEHPGQNRRKTDNFEGADESYAPPSPKSLSALMSDLDDTSFDYSVLKTPENLRKRFQKGKGRGKNSKSVPDAPKFKLFSSLKSNADGGNEKVGSGNRDSEKGGQNAENIEKDEENCKSDRKILKSGSTSRHGVMIGNRKDNEKIDNEVFSAADNTEFGPKSSTPCGKRTSKKSTDQHEHRLRTGNLNVSPIKTPATTTKEASLDTSVLSISTALTTKTHEDSSTTSEMSISAESPNTSKVSNKTLQKLSKFMFKEVPKEKTSEPIAANQNKTSEPTVVNQNKKSEPTVVNQNKTSEPISANQNKTSKSITANHNKRDTGISAPSPNQHFDFSSDILDDSDLFEESSTAKRKLGSADNVSSQPLKLRNIGHSIDSKDTDSKDKDSRMKPNAVSKSDVPRDEFNNLPKEGSNGPKLASNFPWQEGTHTSNTNSSQQDPRNQEAIAQNTHVGSKLKPSENSISKQPSLPKKFPWQKDAQNSPSLSKGFPWQKDSKVNSNSPNLQAKFPWNKKDSNNANSNSPNLQSKFPWNKKDSSDPNSTSPSIQSKFPWNKKDSSDANSNSPNLQSKFPWSKMDSCDTQNVVKTPSIFSSQEEELDDLDLDL